MKQKICNLEHFKTSACKEFVLKKDNESKDAFIIHFDNKYYAYLNSCPHTGVNLNWQEEQFFSLDELFLQCSIHGALFEPNTGACIHGPCVGEKLKALEFVIEDETIYLAE